MSKYQSWKNFIMSSYDARINELIYAIDSIAFTKMDERLLRYLEDKSYALNTKIIQTTHQNIAYDLNASREAVSRLLKKLEQDGTVKLGRNKIELLK
jgi:CRP/FNR family transcriptional regulator